MVRFVRSLVGDPAQADDIVAEAIAIAWEKFTDLEDRRLFTSWIFTIAKRRVSRTIWRRRVTSFFSLEAAEELPACTPPPDASADTVALYEAIAQLPPAQREAILLFEIHGLSLEEVRRIQGVSLSGVKTRLARGRETLARKLGIMHDADDTARRAESPSPRATAVAGTAGGPL